MIIKPSAGSLIDRTHPQLFGCVAWWPMWEGSGTVVRAAVGRNNGTLTNFTAGSEWAAGKDGLAPLFDGVDSSILFASTTLSLTSFTITFRARRTVINVSHAVLGTTAATNTNHLTLSGIGTITLRPGAGSTATGTVVVNDTSHHHYAVVVSSGTVSMFQDGRPMSMSAPTVTQNLVTNVMGLRGGTDNAFNGRLDDVRFYNRILSAAEIRAIHLDPWASVIGWDEPDSEGFWLADAAAGGRRHQQHPMHLGLSLAI